MALGAARWGAAAQHWEDLTWKAREVGLSTRFIELAGEINHAMPDYVVQRVTLALSIVNLTNKAALYNFLSTFSGTHYVTPRALTAEVGFHF